MRSVPATLNSPASNSMSCSLLSRRWAAIFLPLTNDLVARLRQRRAADDERARAVGAHAELHLVGVAEHDIDIVERHAEFLADDLREGRLVALAVTVRADEHRDLSGRMHAHGRALIKTAARAEPTGDARRGQAAGLDVSAEPDAAQLAVARGDRLALGEAGPVGDLQRLVEAAFRIAAVVFHHHRRLVGIGLLGNHVAAADLGLVDPRSLAATSTRRSSTKVASGRPAPR